MNLLKRNETRPYAIQDIGLIEYPIAYQRQRQCVEDVLNGQRERILLCEHPLVLTCGRMTKPGNILAPDDVLKQQGLQVFPVDRGGDVTLHAPGQLVVYPILNLKNYGQDLHVYLRKLEEVAVDFLKGFDILAGTFSGRTGVWVGPRKIVSMGVGAKRWVSFHGMAINVNVDLTLFSLIKPCGLDVRMTSMKEILEKDVDMDFAKARLTEVFSKHF